MLFCCWMHTVPLRAAWRTRLRRANAGVLRQARSEGRLDCLSLSARWASGHAVRFRASRSSEAPTTAAERTVARSRGDGANLHGTAAGAEAGAREGAGAAGGPASGAQAGAGAGAAAAPRFGGWDAWEDDRARTGIGNLQRMRRAARAAHHPEVGAAGLTAS